MWSIMSTVGSSTEPTKMLKGGYHNTMPLRAILGSVNTFSSFLPDKQFPNFINRSNPCTHQNYQIMERNSSRNIQEPSNTKTNNHECNSKKKKKRRRRKKKNKNKNQQSPPVIMENPHSLMRQRQISTTSEDSFVIFCDDEDHISELSENETVTTEDLDSSDSLIPHKKVRFPDDNELCRVHPMIKWSYAYQAARKGPWEEYARDRDRFHKRVVNTEANIGHIFDTDHRSRIYEERFS